MSESIPEAMVRLGAAHMGGDPRTHEAIFRHLAGGPVLLRSLADTVARTCRVDTEEAVACVWDLVQRDEVDYRADGTAVLREAK